MIPVTLVHSPTKTYFNLTYDNVNFAKWYRSNGLPDCAEISKGMMIYANYHLAIGKKKSDGKWAIWRSKDYGLNWALLWTASSGEKIYDIVLIRYGWAIMNTSVGFYELTRSGTTITKIIDLPPAQVGVCAMANIGCYQNDDDIIVCTDGLRIWRSVDIARTWTQVCNMSTEYFGLYGDGTDTDHFYKNVIPTASRIPTIAGANGSGIAAYGPFLFFGINGGTIWEHQHIWDSGNYKCNHHGEIDALIAQGFSPPPCNIIGLRLPTNANPSIKFVIKQIEVAAVDGPWWYNVKYTIRVDDLVPVPGNTSNFSYVFKVWLKYTDPMDLGNAVQSSLKFQQYAMTGYNTISAYDLPITGYSGVEQLVFSSMYRVDASGNSIPSFKYSKDGGETWIQLDLATTSLYVGDPNERESRITASLLDDSFSYSTWTYGTCVNTGDWNYHTLKCRRNLSYDLDAYLYKPETKTYTSDVLMEKKFLKSYDMDMINEAKHTVGYSFSAYAEKTLTFKYKSRAYVEDTFLLPFDFKTLIVLVNSVTYDFEAKFEKIRKFEYPMNVYVEKNVSSSYSMGVQLVQANTSWMWDFFSPQIFNLIFPDNQLQPFDSRV